MVSHSFTVRRKAAKCAPAELQETDKMAHLHLHVNLDKIMFQVLQIF